MTTATPAQLDSMARARAVVTEAALARRRARAALIEAGFTRREIAAAFGTSTEAVRVALIRDRHAAAREEAEA